MNRRQAIGTLAALALPVDLSRPASAGPADETGPLSGWEDGADLGNLWDTVDWIARERSPALSFLDPRWTSLDEWKEAARPAFHRHLSFDPAPAALRAGPVRVEERDGFRIEHLHVHASPAYAIPARVLVPSGRRGRLPGVVALHCHGGQYAWGAAKLVSSPGDPATLVDYRRRLYGGRAYAEDLTRRGFVVIVIDAFYFGARRLRPETLPPDAVPAEAREAFDSLPSLPEGSAERNRAENRVASAFEAAVAKTLLAAGASWPGVSAWDDRRTIDYLVTRDDVDPARIACIGLSGGGLRPRTWPPPIRGSGPRAWWRG